MNKLFAIILTLLLPTVVVAQTPATSVMGSAASSALAGQYRGNVTTRNNGDNAFELVIAEQNGKSVQGTLQFWKGETACRARVPISGTVKDDGTIVIEAPSPMKGCERTLTIKLAGGQLDGELAGPLGLTGFKLEKK
jgi:hypothetical protein